MRARWTAGVVAAVLLLAGCATPTGSSSDTEPDGPSWVVDCPAAADRQATDFTDLVLPCLGGGGDYRLGGVADRPLVIALWASWCAPCATEAEELQQFWQEHRTEVTMIGVDTQDTTDRGRYFAEDFGWTFPSVFDPDGVVLRSQGLTALPATFVVAADGSTVATFTDGSLTAERLARAVSTAMKEVS